MREQIEDFYRKSIENYLTSGEKQAQLEKKRNELQEELNVVLSILEEDFGVHPFESVMEDLMKEDI